MMIQQRNLLTLVLLSLITCGIYGIYFWYQYSNDVNVVCNGDGQQTPNYIVVLLLSMITCGIYAFIWYYGVGNRLQANAPRYGLSLQENGTTVLLWMLFGSFLCGIGYFIAMHIMIKSMNELAAAYNALPLTAGRQQ